jgi:hypothetical protein
VTEAIQANRRVVDANYGPVRDIVWTRATHLVWLDYPRPVIMARVIRRSLLRTSCGPAIASDGGTCYGQAIRSVGPGPPGTAAAARRRTASRGRRMHGWKCCGYATRARYRLRSND